MPTNEPPEPEPSGRTWPGRQVKKHPFIALGVAIVASLAIGWVAGSKITCGPECNADADMIGAIGTWVGGLATASAFFVTARELVDTRRREKKTKELRAKQLLTKARNVKFFTAREQTLTEKGYTDHEDGPVLYMSIANRSDVPITDVRGLNKPNGKEIFHTAQVNPRTQNDNRAAPELAIHLNKLAEYSADNLVGEIISLENRYKNQYDLRQKSVEARKQKLESHTPRSELPLYSQEMASLEQKMRDHKKNMDSLENETIRNKKKLARLLKNELWVEFTLEDHRFYLHKGEVTLAKDSTP